MNISKLLVLVINILFFETAFIQCNKQNNSDEKVLNLNEISIKYYGELMDSIIQNKNVSYIISQLDSAEIFVIPLGSCLQCITSFFNNYEHYNFIKKEKILVILEDKENKANQKQLKKINSFTQIILDESIRSKFGLVDIVKIKYFRSAKSTISVIKQ